ncbi:MAG: type II toxin-antitoxin system RelE/ParE family toxin [Gemmatimonadaceae bacterium]
MSGVLISGTGGARKLRLGIAGRGKRGGVRVIYYQHVAAARVYLLLVYPKSAADDLSQAGRRAMRQLITAIDQEA